jgi:hypothetical protein
MESNTINFDRPKLLALKKAYARAKDFGRDRFAFEGQIFLASYAHYLIQYLESKFQTEKEKVKAEGRY